MTVTVTAASATIFYIYTDQLNTPRAITNEAATTVWRWDNLDPFGANAPNEDPDGDTNKFTFNLRFPGQYFDKETNTHYNYMRDYDPSLGRYTESDLVGLRGGINTYAYVKDNPLSWIDPRGLVRWSGTSRSFNWLAYSRDEYELESECKCGIRARITVMVDSLGVGFGASSTRSANDFEDHFACPNPMAFAGAALTYSATAAARFGVSYNRVLLGAATSSGWSAVEGIGASIGFSLGQARIEDIRIEDCSCNK